MNLPRLKVVKKNLVVLLLELYRLFRVRILHNKINDKMALEWRIPWAIEFCGTLNWAAFLPVRILPT